MPTITATCQTCGGAESVPLNNTRASDLWEQTIPCPACRPGEHEEARRHIRRADTLLRGDIILTPWQGVRDSTGAPMELAEVVHVEPVVGEPEVMIIFKGATTLVLHADEPVRIADDDTAERWLEEVAWARRRHVQTRRLRQLADQLEAGELPTATLHLHWTVADRAALERSAELLGGQVREHSSGASVSVNDSYAIFVDVYEGGQS